MLRNPLSLLRSKVAGKALLLGFTAGVASVSLPALAVGTRQFHMDSLDDLAGGDLAGVAIDSRGSIRPGLDLGKVPMSDAQTTWCSALLGDGSILVGTGNEGKILRVSGGQVSVAALTGQMAVSAMTTAWGGDVIAGSFPNGQLFRLAKGAGKGDEIKPWATLDGAEYVWALAYDEKTKSVYAATGPNGKVLRIDENGKSQVHFETPDTHIVSLAVGPNGVVYAGTSGKALLYAIESPGHASVVYDFDGEDVSGIAVAKDGTVWATSNKYTGGFSMPSKGSAGAKAKGGEGVLMRFKAGVSPEEMMTDRKTHFEELVLDDAGIPYVGTGAEGRVYTVDDNHLVKLVADTDSRQIASLVMSGKKRYLIGSDAAVEYDVKGEGSQDAMWTSKVLDAGMVATFGEIKWQGGGGVALSTRSGNTVEPDASWSAWSSDLAAPGKVPSPKGRYLQVRARFGKDPAAALSEVSVAFVTDNARALITSITAESRLQKKGGIGTGMLSSGGKIGKPSASVSLKWDTENPDKDDLRYRVWYRLEGQKEWRDALKPGEILTGASTEWDTTALPEGLYRIKVEATDELVNPPDRFLSHTFESGLVLVDNTQPVFDSVKLDGRKLVGSVTDGLGPIARIELSVAGSEDWRPIFPKDLVFDSATETFDVDVTSIVPAGSHLLGIRAYDQAGNQVAKELEAK